MKTRLRKIELLSFYDHTGIEAHLTKMAQKGWMIERMSNYFWTYRKIEPQALHFTVSYFPKASDFDPAPSDAQQTLLDFCAATGWALACTWFQMQVFYSPEQDPVPINTEPALEVETLHKACKANYLRAYWVLLAISLVLTLLFLSSLISDTLRLLASPRDLSMGSCCLILFLLSAGELGAYYTWHRRAKRAARLGLFLDTPSTRNLQKVLFVLLGLCVLYWLGNLALLGQSFMVWLVFAVLLCMAAAVVVMSAVKGLLKRKQVPSGANRALTLLACFLTCLVLSKAVVSMGMKLYSSADLEGLPLNVQAPLYVADLLETDHSDYLTTTSADQSLFLERLEVHQRPGFGGASSSDIPELYYELYTVKVPALYSFCEGQLKRLILLSAFWDGYLAEEDPAPWGAGEAYRLVLNSGQETNVYLLCYENRLLRAKFSWQPTQAQMGIVGDTLAN